MKKNDTLLLIPAYNEEMNISTVLESLYQAEVDRKMDILVVNDGSLDRTVEQVKQYNTAVINQCFNMGYGAALQTGYKYAAEHDYRYVIQMDADGQHDVCNLDRILGRLKGEAEPSGIPCDSYDGKRIPDIIIGSRFLKGGKSFDISVAKAFAIGIFCRAIKAYTGYHLTDPTSGLQGLNRKAFTYYARFTNFDLQYPDLNMIIQMIALGFHIEEVPAVMHERTAGVSMHSGLWSAIRYMMVMAVSTLSIINRDIHKKHKIKKMKGNQG